MIVADERFATFVTFIALVLVMNAKVKPVGAPVTETLSADAAQVRFLPAMDPQMLPEGCPLSN